MKRQLFSYLEIIVEMTAKLLPGVAQVLLGAAALTTALKGRKIAKEKVNEKQKD